MPRFVFAVRGWIIIIVVMIVIAAAVVTITIIVPITAASVAIPAIVAAPTIILAVTTFFIVAVASFSLHANEKHLGGRLCFCGGPAQGLLLDGEGGRGTR